MHLHYFKAKVSSTDGRNIKVKHPLVGSTAPIKPLFDGILKLPAPAKGDSVYIFTVDPRLPNSLNYLPADYAFSTLTEDSGKVQIENAGGIELEGSEIKLGANAVEPVLLGDTLTDFLGSLIDVLSPHNHTGVFGVPVTPPLNSAAMVALKLQFELLKSQKVKVE